MGLRRQVHHGIDLPVPQDGRQLRLIVEVTFDEEPLWNRLAMSLPQVVINHRLVPRRQ